MSHSFPQLHGSGAPLQAYNNEMVKCVEDLCSRRDELKRQIESDQEEKAKLHNDIKLLTNRLANINEAIAQKMASQNEFDRAICETQAAYTRVMESSQVLLHTVNGAALKLKAKEAIQETDQIRLPRPNLKKNVSDKN